MRQALTALPCLLFAACGTLMNRGTYHVPIDSVPPGAAISYVDAPVGMTPCTVAMTNYCSQVVLTLPGYHPQVVEAGRGVNGWVVGNLLFGGVIGLAVDGANGSAGTVSTSPIYVELTPVADPRPGVWVRTRESSSSGEAWHEMADDEGWIPAGKPLPVKPRVATRAGPWKPPPVHEDDEGWIPIGVRQQ